MAEIKGYRQLSPDTIELVNTLKEQANNLGEAIDAIAEMPDVDQRWLAIARTELQKGMMFLIRAITNPSGF